jgi:sporulation protein YlmC with PRC-barrel domain
VTVALKSGDLTTHGYWFTWNSKGMQANALGKTTQYGTLSEVDFNYSNSATKQQWIILSEEEMKAYVTRQPGDVNGDGEVSVSDITKIADIILNAEEHPYADVNEDGEISVSDITTVADIILRSE